MNALVRTVVATGALALGTATAAVAQGPAADADIPVQGASEAGRITAVTLYPGRAAVTRTLHRELAQGLWQLRVTDLPASVQGTSLQAKVLGEAGPRTPRLLGVEYAEAPRVAFASSPEGAALAEKAKELELKLAHLKQDRAFLDEHEKLVDKVGVRAAPSSGSGEMQPIDTAAVAKQVAAVRAEKERILGVAREQDALRERLERELAAVREQLAAKGGADRTDRAGIVLLAVPQACTVDVEVTYLVGNASWEPAYAVRAAAARAGVTVEYDAMVVQRTGEDWKDVRLSLSTAQPTRASGPPPVEPWFVDVYVPPPPMPAATGAPAAPAPVMALADSAPFGAEPGSAATS